MNGKMGDDLMTASKSVSSNAAFKKVELFRLNPLFRNLAPKILGKLDAQVSRKKAGRGEIIFAKDDPGHSLIGVTSGAVKISVFAPDGREIVLNIINAGEVFGEIALLDGGPRSADATAMTDCELQIIDRRDFVAIMREEPDMPLTIIKLLCARLRSTSDQVHDVMFLNAATRIAKSILKIAAVDQSGTDKLVAKVTQREISQIVGLSREMTNKQLRIWERAGVVKIARGSIVLMDLVELTRIAADDEA